MTHVLPYILMHKRLIWVEKPKMKNCIKYKVNTWYIQEYQNKEKLKRKEKLCDFCIVEVLVVVAIFYRRAESIELCKQDFKFQLCSALKQNQGTILLAPE